MSAKLGQKAVMRWPKLVQAIVFTAASGCKVYDADLPGLSNSRMEGKQTSDPVAGLPASDDRATSKARSAGAAAPAGTSAGTAGPHSAEDPPAAGGQATRDAGSVPASSADDEDAGTPPNDAGIDSGDVVCVAEAVANYCANLPALLEPPLIDGQIDCALEPQTMTRSGWNGAGSAPVAPVAAFATAWRNDGLYFYVTVRGTPPAPHPAGTRIDCGDALELYVDADGQLAGQYDLPGTAQFIIAAPAVNGTGSIEAIRYINGRPDGILSAKSVATALLDDGYAVEAFITAADLNLTRWVLEPGAQLGFDIAIDVSGTPGRTGSGCTTAGNQRGQYFLRVSMLRLTTTCTNGSGEPFCDNRAFCVSHAAEQELVSYRLTR